MPKMPGDATTQACQRVLHAGMLQGGSTCSQHSQRTCKNLNSLFSSSWLGWNTRKSTSPGMGGHTCQTEGRAAQQSCPTLCGPGRSDPRPSAPCALYAVLFTYSICSRGPVRKAGRDTGAGPYPQARVGGDGHAQGRNGEPPATDRLSVAATTLITYCQIIWQSEVDVSACSGDTQRQGAGGHPGSMPSGARGPGQGACGRAARHHNR